MYDFDLMEGTSERIQMKRLAVQTCVNMIARTISQSEFRVKKDDETLKDEMYYKLNVRPNENMSAAHFWQTVVYKLIHDNECLIVQCDSEDLLIADDFTKVEYGIHGHKFKGVLVNNFQFGRTFDMRDVIYLEYDNERLAKLIDSLYEDYGELFGRVIEFQKHKNQIRSTVDMENVNAKDKETQSKLQRFIDNMYEAVKKKTFAIIPQQKGFTYEEHSTGGKSTQSIEEINKITNGFLDSVAKAMGIPPSLIHGDMADVEKQTRNFMKFCIDPLLEKIKDEMNAKFIKKKEFLDGKHMDIKRISYRDIFDLATAIDKLISSSAFKPNEMREEAGWSKSDDPLLDKHIITKNYVQLSDSFKGDASGKGGDNQSGEEEKT